MHTLSAGCHCGNIRVEVELARSPEGYQPRACDCDFCRKHAAAWISDPAGSLRIHIGEQEHRATYRQGSGLAELLLCANCGVLVGALHRDGKTLHGAVNARIFAGGADFGSERTVSPKTLSAQEKLERWHDVWFSKVSIVADRKAADPE